MRGRSRERSHHDQPVFVRLCNLGRESPCWGTDRGPPPSPSNTSLQRGELLHMRQTLSCVFALLKQQSRQPREANGFALVPIRVPRHVALSNRQRQERTG